MGSEFGSFIWNGINPAMSPSFRYKLPRGFTPSKPMLSIKLFYVLQQTSSNTVSETHTHMQILVTQFPHYLSTMSSQSKTVFHFPSKWQEEWGHHIPKPKSYEKKTFSFLSLYGSSFKIPCSGHMEQVEDLNTGTPSQLNEMLRALGSSMSFPSEWMNGWMNE